jgi:hypothetical protein
VFLFLINFPFENISFCFTYLDAAELVLKVLDSETNRLIGTAKVQNLSTLSINNPIKGYQSVFTNKGDKLGEVFVSLRMFLPGST